MIFEHAVRGGRYLRVADPDWSDALDGSYAAERGGRWNPPGSFAVVYLNRDLETARANVRRRFAGQPFALDDTRPERRPVLVHTDVPSQPYVDVVSDAGCNAAGLPASYPVDDSGAPVSRERCQRIGQRAWNDAEHGIAARSAAAGAWPPGEELAWFQRDTRLTPLEIESFEHWYWSRQARA